MKKFASSLRTPLSAMLMLVVCALPLAAQEDCRDDCHDLSMDVFEDTGLRWLADMVYAACVEAQCPA